MKWSYESKEIASLAATSPHPSVVDSGPLTLFLGLGDAGDGPGSVPFRQHIASRSETDTKCYKASPGAFTRESSRVGASLTALKTRRPEDLQPSVHEPTRREQKSSDLRSKFHADHGGPRSIRQRRQRANWQVKRSKRFAVECGVFANYNT